MLGLGLGLASVALALQLFEPPLHPRLLVLVPRLPLSAQLDEALLLPGECALAGLPLVEPQLQLPVELDLLRLQGV